MADVGATTVTAAAVIIKGSVATLEFRQSDEFRQQDDQVRSLSQAQGRSESASALKICGCQLVGSAAEDAQRDERHQEEPRAFVEQPANQGREHGRDTRCEKDTQK